MKEKVKGTVAGKSFEGEIQKYLPNQKIHIVVTKTDNTEWQRDIERGYPVLISLKLENVDFIS